MSSSGQNRQEVERGVDCARCGFTGLVTAWYDPEESATSITWDCPRCDHPYREEI